LSVTGLNDVVPGFGYLIDVDNSLTSFDAVDCIVTCTAGGWFGTHPVGTANLGYFISDAYYVEAAGFTALPTGVPEPLTMSLFTVGLAGAFGLRRRKKVQA
jgi:hypothetical protein